MAFIEVKHLKYRYPGAKRLALDDISFTVEKGEFIGLLGENGAGKSSLSQALLGLIPQFYKGAYGGSVLVDGLEAAKTPVGTLCQKVGLVFQNPFNQLSGAKDTVFDEVGYGLQNLGIAPEEIRERVETVLRQLGIWEFRDRNPFDLSGGQLQRVAIASVLAMRPALLILDEPTSQLDPAGSEEVFRIVEALAKTGITILMIEQKPEKLAAYCDRLLLMQNGRVLAVGTPEEIFSREDLADCHVEPPVYTSFAREHGLQLPNGCYPVTLSTLLGTMSSARRAELREAIAAGAAGAGPSGDPTRPALLILDEPTSQLDPAGSEEVFRIVEALAKTGITILMIEQKPEKLAAYCDRLLLMQNGRVLAVGTPEEIFSREDLADRHVEPPVYTSFAREHGLQLPNGCYPVTLSALLGTMSSARRAALRETLAADAAIAWPAGGGQGDIASETDTEGRTAAAAASPESFRTEGLGFSYIPGKPVLSGLDLRLDHRPTAIIGQNGAGKTTLVRILKGLLKPESGSVYFGGEDITRHTVAQLSGKVGYVFQNPDDQIFKYKVRDEVMFGPLNIGMSKEQAAARAQEALRQVGLSEQAESNPYDLELSERKLVAIASVLAMDTEAVILDEPTIAQDAWGKAKLREIIRQLQAEGKLVLAILHDMDFVAACFDRVLVMAHGEILADGSPAEVFREKDALEKAAVQPPQLYLLRDAL